MCFNSSALGIQEMGIPEAITHAIEQLPIGESVSSARFGENVQEECKLGVYCTLYHTVM